MLTTSPFQLKHVLPLLILLLVDLAVLSSSRGTGQAANATRQHATQSGRSSLPSWRTCGTWSVVTSPNVGSNTELRGVAAVSASNIWAVGDYTTSSGNYRTLIEHWNGTSWSVVPSPNVGSFSNGLSDVAAIGSSNVWAVGDYITRNSGGAVRTLIEFFC